MRLAGFDDGRHLAECEQLERDARVYPAMEAAALAHSYLPEETAGKLGRYIAEEMGLVDGPTYCKICGTRDREHFELDKSKDVCGACFDEVGEPDTCSKCGRETYEGDWFGSYVWTEAAAEDGQCVPQDVGRPIPDYCEHLAFDGEARRKGHVEWKKEDYVCDRCMGV